MALFDYVGNNTDRKSGHVLRGHDGRVLEQRERTDPVDIEKQKPGTRLLNLINRQEALWPIHRHRLQTETLEQGQGGHHGR